MTEMATEFVTVLYILAKGPFKIQNTHQNIQIDIT